MNGADFCNSTPGLTEFFDSLRSVRIKKRRILGKIEGYIISAIGLIPGGLHPGDSRGTQSSRSQIVSGVTSPDATAGCTRSAKPAAVRYKGESAVLADHRRNRPLANYHVAPSSRASGYRNDRITAAMQAPERTEGLRQQIALTGKSIVNVAQLRTEYPGLAPAEER